MLLIRAERISSCHAAAVERAGIMGLAEGQRVAIDVAQGQKGPEAVGLRLI